MWLGGILYVAFKITAIVLESKRFENLGTDRSAYLILSNRNRILNLLAMPIHYDGTKLPDRSYVIYIFVLLRILIIRSLIAFNSS